ncbi:AMP-binding protein [Pleurocapsales cyanobacterium LEGE 06147]|nr:AMP-binding protein [Pleurocapsales cyanobacterium LEGE 06147]
MIAYIHELFQLRVVQNLNQTAVFLDNKRLTYLELNRQANQLARYLCELGVGPEVVVGLSRERSPQMVVALLAILKAGGAYFPLDPTYPKERLAFMIQNARASILLTQAQHLNKLPHCDECDAKIACLDRDREIIARESQENLVNRVQAKNLANVIYTSGSTGKPKGVAIAYESLANFIKFEITVLDLPTAFWHQLCLELDRERLAITDSLRLVIIGGERARPQQLGIWKKRVNPKVRFVNTYGPTEATVMTTMCDLAGSKAIATSGRVLPIGRVIKNTQTYILDPLLKPVPEREMGQLYIGGIGLVRGYLKPLQQPKVCEVEFFRKTRSLKTPFIIYNLEELDKSYQAIQQALPSVKIYYSVKCNPIERIIERLKNKGSGFEIASLAEAEQLFRQNIKPSEIVCLHPIKSPDFIQYLHHHQIEILAVDSYEEVDKIATFAPESKIVVRINIPNTKSVWSLSGKFGIDVSEAIALLKYIQAKGLIPYGITTHVGSQCEDIDSWLECAKVYQAVLKMAQMADIRLQFVSLGGGLPVRYCQPVPEIEAIGKVIRENLLDYTCNNYQVSIEPGRAMVATMGILVVTVIGLAKRGEQMWTYIDAGTYNGLAEAIETSDRQFYQIVTEHPHRRQINYNIGGPTCASMDAPFQDISLPELQIGDRLYILDVGAYSISCASSFNGFPVPDTYFYQDLR